MSSDVVVLLKVALQGLSQPEMEEFSESSSWPTL
jgi:hypothetical protein